MRKAFMLKDIVIDGWSAVKAASRPERTVDSSSELIEMDASVLDAGKDEER